MSGTVGTQPLAKLSPLAGKPAPKDMLIDVADGIVTTPSHNPPGDGGFKCNPINGGPADTDVTHWVEERANELLRGNNAGVKRVPERIQYLR